MPSSVAIVFAILIGWPALKLAGALLSRPKWREFKRLGSELGRESWFGEAEQRIVSRIRKQAFGSGVNLLGPVIVVVGFAWLAVRALWSGRPFPRIRESRRELTALYAEELEVSARSPLFSDPRFWELLQLSTDLEMLRDPVAGILTVFAVILMMPLLAVAYVSVGLRTPVHKQLPRTPVRRQLETLQMLFASQASFAGHMLRPKG